MRNDLLLKAARGEVVERTPVWLMRQAGRILPEYHAVRKQAKSFIRLVKTPDLAAEVTIQPVDLLGVDAAIIFSDILVVPEAMGLPYEMIEGKGPSFPKTIDTEKDIDHLHILSDISRIHYVAEAIRLTKKKLDNRVPLIGFAGAPFTIFCYMVEGAGSKTFSKARKMLYRVPALSHKLLQMITDSTIYYLKSQINAGADLIQIFDSWAGILAPEQYRIFGLAYIRQICQALANTVPRTVFAKGAYFVLEDFSNFPCESVGLDWNMNIKQARQSVGSDKTLQGNLDPCVLYARAEQVAVATKKMLSEFGSQRYIANLGHGVYPDTDPENVRVFVETVKEYSIK